MRTIRGCRSGSRQHPLFDEDWYVRVNRDVRYGRFALGGTTCGTACARAGSPTPGSTASGTCARIRRYGRLGLDPLDHYYRHRLLGGA